MEKPTIYTSAPRPPKQIRVTEDPVEPIVEKQDLPEAKEDKPSTITVMHPTVPKDTVVKLNGEKQEPVKNDSSTENISLNTDEIQASPQADLETATDFTDNEQIVTVVEPFEEPVAAADFDVDAKVEAASNETDQTTAAVEEPKSAEEGLETEGKYDSVAKKNNENTTIETLAIAEIDAKPDEQPTIETKENEASDDTQEAITNVDAKANEENFSLITDEEITSVAYSNIGETENAESNIDTIADVEADILTEQVEEPDMEFATIAEQYSKSDVVEEVKPVNEPKTTVEKSPKSHGSSKNKVDAEHEFENLKIPGDDELFQRQYYTMGEVATMFHANQSQIRFWENEFDILQPKKNKKGDRYFRPEDVKNLQVIHHLLRNRRFTIEGAREYLKSNKQRAQETVSAIASLSQLKSFLTELKANL